MEEAIVSLKELTDYGYLINVFTLNNDEGSQGTRLNRIK